jgi:hypothetical protein
MTVSNIAFGTEKHEIDLRRVEQVGKMAIPEQFVADDTPHGHESPGDTITLSSKRVANTLGIFEKEPYGKS